MIYYTDRSMYFLVEILEPLVKPTGCGLQSLIHGLLHTRIRTLCSQALPKLPHMLVLHEVTNKKLPTV